MILLLALLLASEATPKGGAWLTVEDYPPSALRRNEQGTARFRVDVTEAGLPENCRIVESSGSPTLDEATCRIVTRRARFTPGVGDDGKPKRSTFESSMKWKLGS